MQTELCQPFSRLSSLNQPSLQYLSDYGHTTWEVPHSVTQTKFLSEQNMMLNQQQDAKTLVHAFISSRLDYCNSLLYGISDGLLRKLQAVQNAAARVVTGARKFDHITPVLRELHWLPVRQRIRYKLAMTVYKCLHGSAPTYLADDCLAISAIVGKRHLRSAGTGLLSVPRTRTTLGMRSFAVAGPVIWNSLPAALRTATLSPSTFARHLKTHLFG